MAKSKREYIERVELALKWALRQQKNLCNRALNNEALNDKVRGLQWLKTRAIKINQK
jgi:hypothetical protein